MLKVGDVFAFYGMGCSSVKLRGERERDHNKPTGYQPTIPHSDERTSVLGVLPQILGWSEEWHQLLSWGSKYCLEAAVLTQLTWEWAPKNSIGLSAEQTWLGLCCWGALLQSGRTNWAAVWVAKKKCPPPQETAQHYQPPFPSFSLLCWFLDCKFLQAGTCHLLKCCARWWCSNDNSRNNIVL